MRIVFFHILWKKIDNDGIFIKIFDSSEKKGYHISCYIYIIVFTLYEGYAYKEGET